MFKKVAKKTSGGRIREDFEDTSETLELLAPTASVLTEDSEMKDEQATEYKRRVITIQTGVKK